MSEHCKREVLSQPRIEPRFNNLQPTAMKLNISVLRNSWKTCLTVKLAPSLQLGTRNFKYGGLGANKQESVRLCTVSKRFVNATVCTSMDEMQGPKHNFHAPHISSTTCARMLQGASADVRASFCSVSISAISDVNWTRSPGFAGVAPALGR